MLCTCLHPILLHTFILCVYTLPMHIEIRFRCKFHPLVSQQLVVRNGIHRTISCEESARGSPWGAWARGPTSKKSHPLVITLATGVCAATL